MNQDLTDRDLRQREIVPPEKLAECHALVIGVGAVGRQVALQLAAMGITAMTLVDHDTVEVVNLAVQGYLPEDLGQAKVLATAAWCRRINPELVVQTHPERFRRSSVKSLPCFDNLKHKLVVFTCVDDIAMRGIIWESVKSQAAFFADARMSAEVVRVLASDRPAENEQYLSTLFSPDQGYVGACTAKSTIFATSIAAGMLLSQFARWLRGLPVDHDLLLNLFSSEMAVT